MFLKDTLKFQHNHINIIKYWCTSYRLSTPKMSHSVMKICIFLSTYNLKVRAQTSDIDKPCTLSKLLFLSVPKSLPSKRLENNATPISYN